MNLETFTYLLEHPEHITASQTDEMKEVVTRYPFFQPARALYLKVLKNQESYRYNKELKRTAAQTQDRSVLFEFITSSIFNQNVINSQIKQQEERLHNMTVNGALNISKQVEEEELQKAYTILDPDFFEPKASENTAKASPQEILETGKPLDFTTDETHSFSEWLKITSFSPIERKNEPNLGENEAKKEEIPPANPERKRKIKLIDQFIANNPKIKMKAKEEAQIKNIPEVKNVPDEALMTETLARVYVEQKNYGKAKQAYKILSLKYPEKSGFFADQIRAIDELQDFKK
ncbi:hypothetical protein [Flavimarina sp. Hel_I_48]|uniref:hypothetical protein n=1 Tax=Flavimarina sp. Hel_I_48 TaxID=1392488 RepID=UPI0004DF4D31|nr:hypothetical protein [Flavimarina sp. Hel_I_48]